MVWSVRETKKIHLTFDPDYVYTRNCLNTDVFHYSIATLQYKRSLTRSSSYMVLFDENKREKYLDTKVEAYTGASSRDSIRRLHNDLIENVRDFDRVNS